MITKIKGISKKKAICCTLSCKKNISKETLEALAEMFKAIVAKIESKPKK